MAKRLKVTEARMKKLVRAGEVLKDFSTSSAIKDIVTVTDIYDVNKTGKNITFDLIFLTRGVGALTNAVLSDVITGVDIPVATNEKDSLSGHPVSTDIIANRKFLKLRSLVIATNETNVPAELDVEFIIAGGDAAKSFVVPKATFKDVGDQIEILVSIFFF